MQEEVSIRPKVKQIDLSSWNEFPGAIRQIYDEFGHTHSGESAKLHEVLFRGVCDASFPLRSSLERSALSENGTLPVFRYLASIGELQQQISSLTGQHWDKIDLADIPALAKSFYDSPDDWYGHYSYMIYLRHHGFPSPLLDWSLSPYIAAFFAFAEDRNDGNDRVAVYGFLDDVIGGTMHKVGEAQIIRSGPNVYAHHRHFRQQSRYTVCVQKNPPIGGWWSYVPYTKVLESADVTQDIFWKITLPRECRYEALAYLDLHNINAYTLFATDEALLQSLYERLAMRKEKRSAKTTYVVND